APIPMAGAGGGMGMMRGAMGGRPMAPAALAQPGGAAAPVQSFLRQIESKDGLAQSRMRLEEEQTRRGLARLSEGKAKEALQQAQEKGGNCGLGLDGVQKRDKNSVQAGKLGVDLSVQTNNLRNQAQLEPTARQKVFGRDCLEIGGVWIDENFDQK